MDTKKQVVVIHGGGEFVSSSYEELLDELKSREVSIDRLRQKGSWKANLQNDLGEHYDVIAPRMPQPDTPRYEAWKLWFEKVIPLLDAEVILVGHSLGGIFLIKYLCENIFPRKILALYTIAAPYNDGTHPFSHSGFVVERGFDQVARQVTSVVLFHSTDDPVVPFDSALLYKEKIPHAVLREFSDKKHFNDEHFPELVEVIQSL